MNDLELLTLIKSLDGQISKEGAAAKFKAFGEVALYANRQGYLRIGIEFLKCAFEETYPDADLAYLFSADSEFGIDHLTVSEEQFKFITG